MEKIKLMVSIKINKPVDEVFNAFIDNSILCKYFTTGASASIRAAGDKIQWIWSNDKTYITVTEVIKDKSVSFTWPGHKVEYDTRATINFEEKNGKTIVTVTEDGWSKDDAGINSALSNSSGWKDMLLCMKAWLEHNIDLRK